MDPANDEYACLSRSDNTDWDTPADVFTGPYTSYFNFDSFLNKNLALAACPHFTANCGTIREFGYDLGDPSTTTYLGNLRADHACTYKIRAESGVPGFSVTSNVASTWPGADASVTFAAASTLQVSWVEYDLKHLDLGSAYGTWPGLGTAFQEVECGSNCVQGMMIPRGTVNDDGEFVQVNAAQILREYHAWEAQAARSLAQAALHETIADINERNWFESIFNDLPTAPSPTMPEEYDGYTFENTHNLGGYGHPTTGMYSVEAPDTSIEDPFTSGNKIFGVVGQGSRTDDVSRVFSEGDQTRFMLVTLDYNGVGATDMDENPDHRVQMTTGAFGIQSTEWEAPILSDVDVQDWLPVAAEGAMADSALALQLSASVAVIASMLY